MINNNNKWVLFNEVARTSLNLSARVTKSSIYYYEYYSRHYDYDIPCPAHTQCCFLHTECWTPAARCWACSQHSCGPHTNPHTP